MEQLLLDWKDKELFTRTAKDELERKIRNFENYMTDMPTRDQLTHVKNEISLCIMRYVVFRKYNCVALMLVMEINLV